MHVFEHLFDGSHTVGILFRWVNGLGAIAAKLDARKVQTFGYSCKGAIAPYKSTSYTGDNYDYQWFYI